MLQLTPRLVHAAQLAALTLVSLVAFAGAGSTGAATSPGLVAAYSFDAGTGTTLADSSGLANTGTISGASWASRQERRCPYIRRRERLGHRGRHGLARPEHRHDDRSLGSPERDRQLAHRRGEGAQRRHRLRPPREPGPVEARRPGRHRRRAGCRRRDVAAAERVEPSRDDLRRHDACGSTSTARSPARARSRAASPHRPVPCTSAATRSGASGSAVRSTTSACTTAPSPPRKSRRT